MKGRLIEVGILSAAEIRFTLLSECIFDGRRCSGRLSAGLVDGRILFDGRLYDELEFASETPCGGDVFAPAAFTLEDVKIGIGFHWERLRRQSFAGSLKIITDGTVLTAVNVIGVEDYLRSVISSEMKATASLEFLKAHAVISRSWLLKQISLKGKDNGGGRSFTETDDCIIRWQDRDDHSRFDVCADDHCQRYQGIPKGKCNPVADSAVASTAGEVLLYGGQICDARFSKCCGGVTERFSTCWGDEDYPYLSPVEDTPTSGGEPFCSCSDESVLRQVLNDYDLETRDFFKWRVAYGRREMADVIRRRSGIDFGDSITALEPLGRGASGRISLLRITGSARTMTVGKELTIRKWLSESHLKSSAFEISYDGDSIVLEGRGWGHGVGLCQIGAAVMGSRGYSYREILNHYFPGAEIKPCGV